MTESLTSEKEMEAARLIRKLSSSRPLTKIPSRARTFKPDTTELIKAVELEIQTYGSMSAAARVHDISPSSLSKILTGDTLYADERLLRRLGLVCILRYERVSP